MTQGEFDPVTARQFVGDAEARRIESVARGDAEAARFVPPVVDDETYAGRVRSSMLRSLYLSQYLRRRHRLERV